MLAKHVLENKTKGYRNHPQLNRFRKSSQPFDAIYFYLSVVYDEVQKRGYVFNKNRIDWNFETCKIRVTGGQVEYEIQHLKNKLLQRDPSRLTKLPTIKNVEAHPLFKKIKGGVEECKIV